VSEGRGAALGVPALRGGAGREGGCGVAVGAGDRRRDRPEDDRVDAAGPGVPVLRDSHVRRAAAWRARGIGALRTGAGRRRGTADRLGNVPPERAALAMGILLGIPASAGWVDKAARVSVRLGDAGFDDAMTAALVGEKVLAADETPVNVLNRTARPAPAAGRSRRSGPGGGAGTGWRRTC
jgi:hypothetical protein